MSHCMVCPLTGRCAVVPDFWEQGAQGWETR